ncbi:hypothetical protein ACH4VX_12940 [Streptomyces sp. NPDC020731]|uniref:hypothetical protein n=1 Tax=Streptomyces sp. NPDC020731 TaxID=3365085 RepID=UPI00378F2ECF
MRLPLVHPGALMYSEIFPRLEPLGLERVAGAARAAGHEVRVVDLRVSRRNSSTRTATEDATGEYHPFRRLDRDTFGRHVES